MAREDNLKHFDSAQSRDEAMKNGRKGGKASGAARRKQKTFKQLIGLALQQIDPDTGETNDVAVVAALVNQAKRGDTKAFAELRNTFEGMLEQKHAVDGKLSGTLCMKWAEKQKNADD